MDAQEFKQHQLVGHWRYANKVHGCDWILLEDGTFAASVTAKGILASRQTGRWTIDGRILVCSSIHDEFDMIGSSEDRDTLLEVTDEYFIIRARDGVRRKYERIN
jgi:hypothetical protein